MTSAASPAGPRPAVALAQWRLPGDRAAAVSLARRVGADRLQLDLGGPGRGPSPGEDGTFAVLTAWRRGLVVDTLAVNRANDVGLHRDGRPHGPGLDLVLGAVDLAHRHGFGAVHVPSFRTSAVADAASFAATATVLARSARRAGRSITVLTESTLGADDAVALHAAVGEPNVRVVADTGNLLDAGHDPVAFVRTCRAAGVLAGTVHVKAPSSTPPGRVAAVTAALLARLPDVDVLLENDYREHPDLLRLDVAAARSHPAEGRTA